MVSFSQQNTPAACSTTPNPYRTPADLGSYLLSMSPSLGSSSITIGSPAADNAGDDPVRPEHLWLIEPSSPETDHHRRYPCATCSSCCALRLCPPRAGAASCVPPRHIARRGGDTQAQPLPSQVPTKGGLITNHHALPPTEPSPVSTGRRRRRPRRRVHCARRSAAWPGNHHQKSLGLCCCWWGRDDKRHGRPK